GKQIVLSSDAPPQDIPELEQRLVSRFQSGFVANVDTPCYDTRVGIVKKKAAIHGWSVPEDVCCYIAEAVTANSRQLEGALVTVHANASTEEKPITLDLARRVLGHLGDSAAAPQPAISAIIDAVIDFFGVKLTDLQSKRRQRSIVQPRQVCMYLIRKNTRYSLEEIGGHFGGRDHTTVLHAVRTIEHQKNQDADFSRQLAAIELRFRPGGSPVAQSAAGLAHA
ncbi:MAG TPA: helix-turn-helix domain-containing protein, partial [Phycisphaerales bacterium]|nr:helix-turn-helix domain-containing protein [Phycisphaerales bacterium]